MNPNDIQNKKFDKGMGGYKTEEVTAYLQSVAQYVEDILEDNSDLEKKINVLADKLEEYREDEDSLRAALISAQKLGDSVVRESKAKAETILSEAIQKSEELIANAKSTIEKETSMLFKMQEEVTRFKDQILMMYQRQIEMIQLIPYGKQPQSKPPIAQINQQKQTEQQPQIQPPEQRKEETPELESQPFRLNFEDLKDDKTDSPAFPKAKSSKRGELRFGEEYALERNE